MKSGFGTYPPSCALAAGASEGAALASSAGLKKRGGTLPGGGVFNQGVIPPQQAGAYPN